MQIKMSKKKNKDLILKNIKLLSAGAKGVSVGKTDNGKTIMVEGAVPGDVADVRILKSKKNYLQAEVISITEKSQFRIEPKCIHFGICGGCKWQNLDYKKQLEFKQEEVYNNIQRIGTITNFEKLPILGSKEQYFYRNKMEFSFSNARWLTQEEVNSNEKISDKNALGFHISGQWSKILDIEKCHLQPNPSNEIRLAIKKYAQDNGLEFYDLRQQKGFLRTIMLRQNSKGEWMVLIQFYEENKHNRENILNFLIKTFPQISSLLYAINPKGNDSIYDLNIETYHGESFLYEEMDGLKFKIGPKSFFQTNYNQALELYRTILKFAELKGDEVIYDLYTGTGTIAQYLARNAKEVIGIESVQEAIDAAREHAQLNGLNNCRFYCGDMKDIFNEEFIKNNPKADILITDPPRDGMHEKVSQQILNLSPKKIIYVSCNSATQARDLLILKDNYNLVKVLPIDMFPQTHHVENIAVLERKL